MEGIVVLPRKGDSQCFRASRNQATVLPDDSEKKCLVDDLEKERLGIESRDASRGSCLPGWELAPFAGFPGLFSFDFLNIKGSNFLFSVRPFSSSLLADWLGERGATVFAGFRWGFGGILGTTEWIWFGKFSESSAPSSRRIPPIVRCFWFCFSAPCRVGGTSLFYSNRNRSVCSP